MPLRTKVTYCTFLISIFRPLTAFRPVFLSFQPSNCCKLSDICNCQFPSSNLWHYSDLLCLSLCTVTWP
jgi:hypothetical protein